MGEGIAGRGETGGPTPLPLLVQAAIQSTVADHVFRDADQLVDKLRDRGEDAWRQTALLLIHYVLYRGGYGCGQAAADQFLTTGPPGLSRR